MAGTSAQPRTLQRWLGRCVSARPAIGLDPLTMSSSVVAQLMVGGALGALIIALAVSWFARTRVFALFA